MSGKVVSYWIKRRFSTWKEVNKEQFIKAERDAGFYPKSGNGLATNGFFDGDTQGKITTGAKPL